MLCNIEGPLNPLWVNNIPSWNKTLLKETIASTESPVNSLHVSNIFSLNVRGTKAGKVSMILWSNFLAIS